MSHDNDKIRWLFDNKIDRGTLAAYEQNQVIGTYAY